MILLSDLTVAPPPAGPADWNDAGVVRRVGFWPDAALEPYRQEWRAATGGEEPSPHGWADCTPYMRCAELRALLCGAELASELEELVGQPMGVHLNLTGWISTERDWHQDSYLNPPWVGDAYAAVWIALGDIAPESGPFQYVPGSHRWPQITRALMGQHLDLNDPDWPWQSEEIVAPLFDAEIERRDALVVNHLPASGDLLIWHGRLLHRGSRPLQPGLPRPALIAHFSGIMARPDMPPAQQHPLGGWFFPLEGSVPVGRAARR